MAKMSDKELAKYTALREEVESQRYFVLEIVKSDVRMGGKMSELLIKEVKKLEKMEEKKEKVADKVFNF